ncbi:uncharacterized protein N7500_002706 [Penicillium coprophilum]|uniref:uncharacterized protein n=1 Tax=Penicillium coprophilum TaxID=36646 RepID=UPI00238BBCE8|nr:uncharacterized protein N7500_002706 [Penicillium coprophilum]KAJ5169923.1 hypothetical protein N7500_002706 [Penicillium coprophilum]
MVEDIDIVPFGHLPFDFHIMEKWDPNSPLTKTQQFRALVESWTRLGKPARNKYPDGDDLLPEEIPPHVPQDLLSDEDRAVSGQTTRLLWIRTWYGQRDDQASQDTADADYNRLHMVVFGDGVLEDACLGQECIFDNKEEFGPGSITMPDGDTNSDFVDGIACGTPGSVPSYMITALMHRPDMLDGLSRRDWPAAWYEEPDVLEKFQSIMVIVADRKACEEGWVLLLAPNHRGEILPFRIRERAAWVYQQILNFMEGQNLEENTTDPDQDVEFYMRENPDGWAPDSVL